MNSDPPAGGNGPVPGEPQLPSSIAELAAVPLAEPEFLQELLKRCMLALRAAAGAIWMRDGEGRLALQAAQYLETTGFFENASMRSACEQPFSEVINTGAGLAYELEEQTPGAAPRKQTLLLAGLQRQHQVAGVVQIFDGLNLPEEERPRRLEMLIQACGQAARHWINFPAPVAAPTPSPATLRGNHPAAAAQPAHPAQEAADLVQAFLAQSRASEQPQGAGGLPPGMPAVGHPALPGMIPASPPATPPDDSWMIELFDSRRMKDVSVIAANEGRRLLGIDRVAVAEQYGPRAKIRATSGLQAVSARSNVVRMLAKLTEQVLATGEKFSYTGAAQEFPPQFETLLADYLLESRSRVVIIQPLFGPKPQEPESQDRPEIERHAFKKPKPVGALIVEQISETPLPSDLDARLDRLAPFVGLALRNAQSYEGIFLMPLWQFLGNLKTRLKGRRLAQIAAGLAATLALVLILVLVQWNYRVVGKGRLMPIDRRSIFAPFDGEVVDLLASSGQQVHEGDLLIRMKNEELQGKLLAQTSMMQEKRKQALAIAAQLIEPATLQSSATEIKLSGELAQLKVEIEGAEQQVEILTRQVEALVVRAPITGVVATFRIEELLRKRPVKKGDLLLEVMDPSGTWRLELDIPENRVGHILEAQKGLENEHLPVRYMLATATELTFDGNLESLSTRSVSSESEGTVVPAFVSLASPQPADPRIGAEVTAKIECGRRSLGYVLFGDVIEFLRKHLWL